MATRQSGEITMRFKVNWPIRPRRKQPVKLTSRVPTAPKMAINAKRNVAPIRPGKSVVETIAQLDKDFPRIQEVGAAESETVVEQDAAVGDVDGLQVGGEFFAETFAERKVKSGVRLEMIAGDIRIAVGESRSVIDVR